MPALVAGIHAFPADLKKARRGWPGQKSPAMTEFWYSTPSASGHFLLRRHRMHAARTHAAGMLRSAMHAAVAHHRMLHAAHHRTMHAIHAAHHRAMHAADHGMAHAVARARHDRAVAVAIAAIAKARAFIAIAVTRAIIAIAVTRTVAAIPAVPAAVMPAQ